MKRRYWITPPELYQALDSEFAFDFDPCPYPRPEGYNSLVVPWGASNYVNPPFNTKDAPYGGPAAFVRKAIIERKRGNSSVFVLPLPHSLGLLMAAGAEIRYGGIVQWLDAETRKPCPRKAPQAIAILHPESCQPLLPCPFCGASGPAFRGVHDCHYIQCEGCGASGPDCDNQDEAERTWNLRLERTSRTLARRGKQLNQSNDYA